MITPYKTARKIAAALFLSLFALTSVTFAMEETQPSHVTIEEKMINCNTQNVIFSRVTHYRPNESGQFEKYSSSVTNNNRTNRKIYTNNDDTRSIASCLENYAMRTILESVHPRCVVITSYVQAKIDLKLFTVYEDETRKPYTISDTGSSVIAGGISFGSARPHISSVKIPTYVTLGRVNLDPVSVVITAHRS